MKNQIKPNQHTPTQNKTTHVWLQSKWKICFASEKGWAIPREVWWKEMADPQFESRKQQEIVILLKWYTKDRISYLENQIFASHSSGDLGIQKSLRSLVVNFFGQDTLQTFRVSICWSPSTVFWEVMSYWLWTAEKYGKVIVLLKCDMLRNVKVFRTSKVLSCRKQCSKWVHPSLAKPWTQHHRLKVGMEMFNPD